MFEVWKLKRRAESAKKKVHRELRQFDPKSPSFHDEVVKRMPPLSEELFAVHNLIEMHYTQKLIETVRRLDLEVPDHMNDAEGLWRPVHTTSTGDDMALTPKGRSYVRKLIDAEKARRFEVKTLWVTKFWLPLLAALVGILGALTGLFAVMQKKAEPDKKPSVYERHFENDAAKE